MGLFWPRTTAASTSPADLAEWLVEDMPGELEEQFPGHADRFQHEGSLRAAIFAVLWHYIEDEPEWNVQAEVKYGSTYDRADVLATSGRSGVTIEVKHNPTPRQIRSDLSKLAKQVNLRGSRADYGVFVCNRLPPGVDASHLDDWTSSDRRRNVFWVVTSDRA